jgi:hypothetical protein
MLKELGNENFKVDQLIEKLDETMNVGTFIYR